jgi:(p)ppGpp synthase/HD superfamily hydrolase
MSDPLVVRARELGQKAHEGQMRKFEGTPYFVHPSRVAAMMAARADATPELVAAAFLHDSLEDTALTPAEIEAACGMDVLVLVMGLTNSTKALKGVVPRKDRKKMETARLGQQCPAVKILKMLDRLDNLRGMLANPDPKFREMYGIESLALVDMIGGVDRSLATEVIAAAVDLIVSAAG